MEAVSLKFMDNEVNQSVWRKQPLTSASKLTILTLAQARKQRPPVYRAE